MTRRDAICYSLSAGLTALRYPASVATKIGKAQCQIGDCDWSIEPADDAQAFAMAK
ncbi:hypothetical protein [Spirosoma humi]